MGTQIAGHSNIDILVDPQDLTGIELTSALHATRCFIDIDVKTWGPILPPITKASCDIAVKNVLSTLLARIGVQ